MTRKTFSTAEKAELLKSYQDSGKAKKTWCKENGLGLSTLQRWLHQENNQINPQPLQNWVSIVPTAPVQSKELEIQIGKCIVPINRQTDLNLLTGVLKVLVEVC